MIDLTDQWTPTQAEFDAFAMVSGDDNAIHVDHDFASRTAFGRTVSHGMLIYAKLWGLLRRHHPQARQTQQTMMFPAPCFAGEAVDLSITGTLPGTLSLRASRAADGTEVLVAQTEVA
ncbi:MaoC family dehydratase [Thalassorhabdomicrobium marinisediminis]|uniref:Hydratase n=1 Tax=Thalassorhabdomicrobium marinisediminis TaxID=2170577 RepID=A0A2T7FX78_9RHOB|nr:MaoC/PaaZ C-terminal domain-containing protein [Thalassorhabdomicrobium marinisediminis]PVA06767.1 hydratase [Thalassorhabdomicrobium marinisediminis]